MEKSRFAPNKVRVVYTSIAQPIGRKLPYTPYRQLAMAGIHDVYLLLSEQEIKDAKVEKILNDTPESDLDIQMDAAKFGGVNLHIINTQERKTEKEKLEFFRQLNRVDHSPLSSTIVISDNNTPLNQMIGSGSVTVKTDDFWLSDSQWIMNAAIQINDTIFKNLANRDMSKAQLKHFFEIRRSCYDLLKKYTRVVELRQQADDNLEAIRKEFNIDAQKTGTWQEQLVKHSIIKRKAQAIEKLRKIEDSAKSIVKEMVQFIDTFQGFRAQFLTTQPEKPSETPPSNK